MSSTNETALLEQINNQAFFDNNLGPFCAGLGAQVFMMGVLWCQTWQYYALFPNDSRWYKGLVAALFLTGAMQTGTDFHLLYDSFVTGYGRILYWNHFGWTFSYEYAWTAGIGAISQAFFLHRCYTVTRSKALLGVGIVGIILSFSSAVAASVAAEQYRYFTDMGKAIYQLSTWLTATAVTDLMISITLMLYLRRVKSEAQSAQQLINKTIRMAWETSGLTSFVAIVDVILYLVWMKQNSAHLFFQLIIGKMYSHSVMVTLLSRQDLKEEHQKNLRPALGIITITRTQMRVDDEGKVQSDRFDVKDIELGLSPPTSPLSPDAEGRYNRPWTQ